MTGNIQRWPDPDSRNERLVDARSTELELGLAAAASHPDRSGHSARSDHPDHGTRADRSDRPDHGSTGPARRGIVRRRRARAAAACATAATLATVGAVAAIPADAATHAQPPTAAAWKVVKTVSGPNDPYFSTVTAVSGSNAWAFAAAQNGKVKPTAWHLSGGTWS
jgi:hypothetical protein